MRDDLTLEELGDGLAEHLVLGLVGRAGGRGGDRCSHGDFGRMGEERARSGGDGRNGGRHVDAVVLWSKWRTVFT